MSTYKIMSREGDTIRIAAPKDVFNGEFLIVNGQPVMALEEARIGTIMGFLKRGQVAYSARALAGLDQLMAPSKRGILKGYSYPIFPPNDRDPEAAAELVAGCQAVYPDTFDGTGPTFLGYVQGFDDQAPGGGRWLISLGDPAPAGGDTSALEQRIADVEADQADQYSELQQTDNRARSAQSAANAASNFAGTLSATVGTQQIQPGASIAIPFDTNIPPSSTIVRTDPADKTKIILGTVKNYLVALNLFPYGVPAGIEVSLLLDGTNASGFVGQLNGVPATKTPITTFIQGAIFASVPGRFLSIVLKNTGASAAFVSPSGSVSFSTVSTN